MPTTQFERRQAGAPIAVSVAEACRLTGLGRTRIYQAMADRELDSLKIGRRRLVLVVSLHAFVDRHRVGCDDAAA